MFFQAHRIIAIAVKTFGIKTSKVTHTRQCDGNQTVNKFVHIRLAKRNFDTQWHIFTHFKCRDRITGTCDNRLLTRNQFHISIGSLHFFSVCGGFTNTHIQNNLIKLRHLHRVGIAELFSQLGANAIVIVRLKTWNVICFSHR